MPENHFPETEQSIEKIGKCGTSESLSHDRNDEKSRRKREDESRQMNPHTGSENARNRPRRARGATPWRGRAPLPRRGSGGDGGARLIQDGASARRTKGGGLPPMKASGLSRLSPSMANRKGKPDRATERPERPKRADPNPFRAGGIPPLAGTGPRARGSRARGADGGGRRVIPPEDRRRDRALPRTAIRILSGRGRDGAERETRTSPHERGIVGIGARAYPESRTTRNRSRRRLSGECRH